LRQQLLARRRDWLQSPAALKAGAALSQTLHELLAQLEPQCLGLYWPLEGEFEATAFAQAQGLPKTMALALPSCRKAGRQMDYLGWDGSPPMRQDECGIATASGPAVVPDVLLVPCVGYTREAYRLGYGGGYFDRWLALHPGVTTVGLAWSCCEAAFAIEAHDQPLTLIVTERELIAP